jgi:PST family polysaccharide transporter
MVGASTIANTGVSVVRNKLIAIILGPAGVGLFAMLLGVQNVEASVAQIGMQTGALRYFALYRGGDPDRVARYFATSSRAFLWLSLAATAICLVFIRPITQWISDDTAYLKLLIPAILGIPFVVQSQTWLYFLQAGLDIRAYSRALVLTSVAGLVVLAPLLLMLGLVGASLHLFAFAVLGWVVARWMAQRSMGEATRAAIQRARFDRETMTTLSRFGAANLLPFVLTMAFPFLLRVQIVQDVGLTENGIYQALFVISMQYLAIPLNAMTAYSFPRISQLTDLGEINNEVNNATRISLLFSAAGILGILLVRDTIIELLFSAGFLAAVVLFPVQMVGDLIKSASFAVQLPLLPQGRHRARNIMAVIHYGTFAAVFFAFPREQRLWGAVWGHTISWGVHLVMHLVYLRRVNDFRLTPENMRLLLGSTAAVTAVAAMPFPDWRWRIVGLAVACIWAVTSISRREIEQFTTMVRAKLKAARPPDNGGGGA